MATMGKGNKVWEVAGGSGEAEAEGKAGAAEAVSAFSVAAELAGQWAERRTSTGASSVKVSKKSMKTAIWGILVQIL